MSNARRLVAALAWSALSLLAPGCADGGSGGRDGGRAFDARAVDAPPAADDAAPDAPRPTAQICDACNVHEDCGPGRYCVSLTVGGRACVPNCAPDLPECPRRFNCVMDLASGVPETVCEPVGGPCCVDADGDGYGQGVGCSGRDCDDAEEDVNPGVPEHCNDVDDDCDGRTDEASAELCDDGEDQDCDALVDCADVAECGDGASCGEHGRICESSACVCPGGATEVVCGDAIDDDCDGVIDCADSDCEGDLCDAMGRTCAAGSCGCAGGGTETACADALDNDCDGLTDCADPNCNALTCGPAGRECAMGLCACPRGTAETSCEDGIDSDCDGLVDCGDPDCNARTCGTFGRVCGAGVCGCPGGTEVSCEDGLDSDCDGAIDCADSDCGARACGANGLVCIAAACQCPMSAELCNGSDDDCDSVVDDTCPTGLGLCCAAAGTTFGGGGGSAFTRACAAGHALVGIDGRAGGRLDAATAICAPISMRVDTTATPEHRFLLTTGAAVSAGGAGGGGGTAFTDRCAPDEVIIGIAGRSGSEVDSLSFQCGRVSFVRSGGGWAVSVVATGTGPAHGGTGGTGFGYTCPAGRIATGIAGRAGDRIDAISLGCSSVTFTSR